MSAVFSASGKTFDVDGYLAASEIRKFAESWHAGIGPHDTNGFQIVIKDDPDLEKQIESVTHFIAEYLPELKRLRTCSSIETVDFRIAYFWSAGVAALTYELPSELHVALAQIPASLTFCVYPCSEEEGEPDGTDNSGAAPLRV